MRQLTVAVIVCAVVANTPRASAADRVWFETKGPHFTLVSDATEKSGRDALWTFEQLRAAIAKLWPWAAVDGDRPLLVVMPRDESEMRALYWAPNDQARAAPSSAFFYGTDRYFLLVRADMPADHTRDINPYRGALSAYVNMVLRTGGKKELPYWAHAGFSS